MMLALTTTVIITVVKSSLALSLGLVGALSIVRFRAAIKEPEELAYLFLTIAIGLGLGADQRMVTIVAFFVIILLIGIIHLFRKPYENQNLYLTVTNIQSNPVRLDQIVDILKKFCSEVQLRRFDETQEVLEATFLIACDDFEQLNKSKNELQKLSKSLKVTFLANNGIS